MEFKEWIKTATKKEKRQLKQKLLDALPDDFGDRTWAQVEEELGESILEITRGLGFNVSQDDLEDLLDVLDEEWMPPPDNDEIWRLYF